MCQLNVFSLLCAVYVLSAVRADLRFASYYGSHMVLQKAPEQAVLWGYGSNEYKVTVFLVGELEFHSQVVDVQNGTWRVTLPPQTAGGPYNVTAIQQDAQVTLTDLLFGDVWLCGGQSNMAFPLSQVFNASAEKAQAAKYPDVRIFMAALELSQEELIDLRKVQMPWSVPSADLVGNFSAVCWLFGRYLYKILGYPVGLVESCWGGTPVEAWSSTRALQKCGLDGLEMEDNSDPILEETSEAASNLASRLLQLWDFLWALRKYNDYDYGCFIKSKVPPFCQTRFFYIASLPNKWGPSPKRENSVLWNAMIHPFLNMTIKGAIWYQGEDNTAYHLDKYACSFPAMIDDWREAFHLGSGGQTAMDFPFGFVQLCTYNKSAESDSFPELRWHQTADYGFSPNPRMKNTFMAVALDLPDEKSPWGSIHPRDKQDVAYRLTLGARAVAYGEKGVAFQGPFPVNVLLKGDLITVTYTQAVSVAPSKSVFEICCTKEINPCNSNSTWLPAPIMQWGHSYVQVSTATCENVVAGLRYAWRDWPCDFKACPVYSDDEELPAPPFTINRWP